MRERRERGRQEAEMRQRRGRKASQAAGRALAGMLALALVTLLGAAAASAQTAREDSVARRPRPDFTPIGIQPEALGSFILFPRLGLTAAHDDNVFRQEDQPIADSFLTFLPSVDLRSDWDNHSLVLSASAAVGRFSEQTSEDFEDYKLAFVGRVDVTEFTHLNVSGSHQREHEPRTSPDQTGQPEPTVFFADDGAVSVDYKADAIGLRASVSVERLNFRDVGTINNDDRDQQEVTVALRASYEAVPGARVFIEPQANFRDRVQSFDDAGFDRDSRGLNVLAGLTLDISGVTYAEFGLGYLQQDFDDPRLATARGVSFSATAFWNPTDLLSLSADLSRRVDETTIVGASSVLTTRGRLRADYELLDNLLLDASIGFDRQAFVGIERRDDTLAAEAGAKYLMNEYFDIEARYAFTRRSSNERGQGFSDNLVTLRVGGQI